MPDIEQIAENYCFSFLGRLSWYPMGLWYGDLADRVARDQKDIECVCKRLPNQCKYKPLLMQLGSDVGTILRPYSAHYHNENIRQLQAAFVEELKKMTDSANFEKRQFNAGVYEMYRTLIATGLATWVIDEKPGDPEYPNDLATTLSFHCDEIKRANPKTYEPLTKPPLDDYFFFLQQQ